MAGPTVAEVTEAVAAALRFEPRAERARLLAVLRSGIIVKVCLSHLDDGYFVATIGDRTVRVPAALLGPQPPPPLVN
jgi:hypothetical protein